MTSRHLLPLLASAALLTGCGGSSSDPSTPEAAPSTSPSAGVSAPAAVSGAKPSAAAASAPGSTTRVTSPAAAPPPAAAPRAGAASTAATSTAPGTYTYDNRGTVTAGTPQDASGTSTLTVDPPGPGGQHSVLVSDTGRTEQDVVLRPSGTFLTRLVIANPAFTKEFRPADGLLVPTPAPAGRSWAWTATSTDGKTTAAVTARVARTETLTVGGQRVVTTVITSTLKLSGDIAYTAQMQTWYAAAHRLSAKEHTKGSGSYGGFAFTTDITSTLRSTRPS